MPVAKSLHIGVFLVDSKAASAHLLSSEPPELQNPLVAGFALDEPAEFSAAPLDHSDQSRVLVDRIISFHQKVVLGH